MNTDPPVVAEVELLEPEKMVLGRAAPVARERAPTGTKRATIRRLHPYSKRESVVRVGRLVESVLEERIDVEDQVIVMVTFR